MTATQQKRFSVKFSFSKCGEIDRNLQFGLHVLKKILMENFILRVAILTLLQMDFLNTFW